jgi:hypothetical protein
MLIASIIFILRFALFQIAAAPWENNSTLCLWLCSLGSENHEIHVALTISPVNLTTVSDKGPHPIQHKFHS